MPRPPRSAPRCIACKADAGERRLWTVHLARPFTNPAGKRTTRTIPCRICKPCVAELLAANASFGGDPERPDLLERSRPVVPRPRVEGGRWANRIEILELAAATSTP